MTPQRVQCSIPAHAKAIPSLIDRYDEIPALPGGRHRSRRVFQLGNFILVHLEDVGTCDGEVIGSSSST